MSREKTERLFNLTLALLGTRNFLTKSQILNSVQGYDGPSESADRMFERDKDDLRELGIPIEVRQIDPLFDDEPGYRIDRRKYQLPPLMLTAREMALLSIAAQAWQSAALAGPAVEGLRKLIASGADPEPDFQATFLPSMSTSEPAFGPLWSAVREAKCVRFHYRRPGESSSRERSIDPWGLLSRNGLWYVIGRDHEHDAPRVFRLSRIEKISSFGKPQAFTLPEGVDIWSHARLLDPNRGESQQAKVRISPERAAHLRHRGVPLDEQTFLIDYVDEALFASELAALGSAIKVLEPASLLNAVDALLKEAVRKYG